MLSICKKLFNVVFETGFIPDNWSIGIIKPFYNILITIIRCIMLFPVFINNRLVTCIEYKAIGPEQAAFF